MDNLVAQTPIPDGLVALVSFAFFAAALMSGIALARHWRLTGRLSHRLCFVMFGLFLGGLLVGFGLSGTK
jgi:hypothetical protein